MQAAPKLGHAFAQSLATEIPSSQDGILELLSHFVKRNRRSMMCPHMFLNECYGSCQHVPPPSVVFVDCLEVIVASPIFLFNC